MAKPFKIVVSANGSLRAGLLLLERSPDFPPVPIPGVSDEVLRDCGLSYLILDLSQVGQVSSSALGWLIRLADQLRSRQGSLVLVGLQERIRVVIEILGLNVFLDVAEDLEAAFEILAAPRPEPPPSPPSTRRGPVYGAPPPRRDPPA
jgi:anti-anti-sigma factor